MQLTENFTLEEMAKSPTADRLGIDNTPSRHDVERLRRLCLNVLQPVRDFWGPVRVTSGFRCQELNRVIGGSPTSQHTTGEAADFEIPGVSNVTISQWVIDSTDFDQLILEYFTGPPNSGWIHVSYGPRQRREILHKQKGQPYKKGLGWR